MSKPMSKAQCDPFSDKQHKQSKFIRADMSRSDFDAVDLTDSKFWAVMTNTRLVRYREAGATEYWPDESCMTATGLVLSEHSHQGDPVVRVQPHLCVITLGLG